MTNFYPLNAQFNHQFHSYSCSWKTSINHVRIRFLHSLFLVVHWTYYVI